MQDGAFLDEDPSVALRNGHFKQMVSVIYVAYNKLMTNTTQFNNQIEEKLTN